MPRAVVRFELVAYLYLVLSLLQVSLAEIVPALGVVPSDHEFRDTIVVVLISFVLVFAAARRRQNWARWIYSISVVVGLAVDILVRLAEMVQDRSILGFDLMTLLHAADVVTAIASVYFAF